MWEELKKAVVRYVHKLASIKVTVLAVATILLTTSHLDETSWLVIAGAIVGGNVLQKFGKANKSE